MTYPQRSRFTETQAFATWVYALLLLITVPSLASLAWAAAKAPSLRWLLPADTVIMALVFNLLCLRTTVTDQEVIAARIDGAVSALPASYPSGRHHRR